MSSKWSVYLLVFTALPFTAVAQQIVTGPLNFGMPDRDYAPGVLVFYSDPFGPDQSQVIAVKPAIVNGLPAAASLKAEDKCNPWLLVGSPNALFPFAPTEVTVRPFTTGVYSCSVSVIRGDQRLGAVPVTLNVGGGAAGTTAGIAAPKAVTIYQPPPASGAGPAVITVNAPSYYATILTVASGDFFPGVGLPSVTTRQGSVAVDHFPDLLDFMSQGTQYLYIETASGAEVVRFTIQRRPFPSVTVVPTTINLSYQAGGPPPTASLTIDDSAGNAGPGTVSASASWIKVGNPGGQGLPQTYPLSVDTSLLPNGLNTGNVKVALSRLPTLSWTVPVVVLVSGSTAVPGALSLSASSLSFNAAVKGPQPANQTVTVSSATPANYLVTASAQSGSWLKVSPGPNLNTTANPSFQVIAQHAGLNAGTYIGSVTVAAPASGFSRIIPVTLTVTNAPPPPPPAISATPAAFAFHIQAGGPAPAAVSLQVGGPAGLPFASQVSSDGNWLAVSPASGTLSGGGAALSVGVNPVNLSLGSHTGNIVLSATNGAATSMTIPVTLDVTAPLPTIARVSNAASYSADTIAPGEIVTIFGENLGPAELATLSLDQDGNVATSAGGVQVLIGGYAAPLIYATERQVSAIVPYEIARPFIVSPTVIVKYRGQSSNGFPMTQAGSAPGIFTADSSGTGHGAILNGDFSPNSPENPAAPGGIVQIFVTGEGQTDPPGATGKITTVSASGPLTPQPLLRVSATIDGQPATVLFYGEAPSLVAGLMQLNVEIPAAARAGDLPVVVTLGSGATARETQAGVTVSVR